jgi:PAS domain S-box-containing protein
LMTDEKGAQQFASKSWIDYVGFIPEGDKWLDVIHPDDINSVVASWMQTLESGKTYKIELRLKNKEGQYRWHSGHGEPIRDKDGNIINWIGSFTDIHDRKTFADKLESEVAQRTIELERSNKELESFNYIASHDLQEPLRKIQTFILLLGKSGDEEEQKRYIDKITTSAQRMSKLIQSVLEYSRLSQAPAVFEATDLNQILENVISDYELLIAEKAAVIKSEKLPVIKAVPLQMQQLFSNLISNSLKFSSKDPVIKIASRIVSGREINIHHHNVNADQKFAEIKFSDNGIGFDQQYSEQIFKLFQRLHSKSEYSGTGVGLSIVSKILEKHNGLIKVESANNKGATFTVWLPYN